MRRANTRDGPRGEKGVLTIQILCNSLRLLFTLTHATRSLTLSLFHARSGVRVSLYKVATLRLRLSPFFNSITYVYGHEILLFYFIWSRQLVTELDTQKAHAHTLRHGHAQHNQHNVTHSSYNFLGLVLFRLRFGLKNATAT